MPHTVYFGCCYTYTPAVRVLSLWSSVIHEFCDRLPSCPVFMWARGFDCARAVRSLVCMHCFMLERGVRIPHSCLEFRFRVGVRTLALQVLSLCGSVRSRVRSAACSSVLMCYVVFFLSAACIHVMSCVNTWLMSFLISCMFMSCFAHSWRFVFLVMCLCFVLCEHVALS